MLGYKAVLWKYHDYCMPMPRSRGLDSGEHSVLFQECGWHGATCVWMFSEVLSTPFLLAMAPLGWGRVQVVEYVSESYLVGPEPNGEITPICFGVGGRDAAVEAEKYQQSF